MPVLYIKDKQNGNIAEMVYTMRNQDANNMVEKFRAIFWSVNLDSFDTQQGLNIVLVTPTDLETETAAEELLRQWEDIKNEFDDEELLANISLTLFTFPITEEYLTDAVFDQYRETIHNTIERIEMPQEEEINISDSESKSQNEQEIIIDKPVIETTKPL